jgi:catechol 2,3-dioxygenase-like lactoylglutathione lyase family enzyme
MLDHLGFGVSDYARSKAFYLQALAPLGIGLVMEVTIGSADRLRDRRLYFFAAA